YAPCALGATVNDDTIPKLKAKVIAGSANNQLKTNKHGDTIHDMGIVYTPDYVLNSGGVINVADELNGYNHTRAMKNVDTIYTNLTSNYDNARLDNIPTYIAADRMAEERIESIKKSINQFLLNEHHTLSRR